MENHDKTGATLLEVLGALLLLIWLIACVWGFISTTFTPKTPKRTKTLEEKVEEYEWEHPGSNPIGPFEW